MGNHESKDTTAELRSEHSNDKKAAYLEDSEKKVSKKMTLF